MAEFMIDANGNIIPPNRGALIPQPKAFADFIAGQNGVSKGGLPAVRPVGNTLPAVIPQAPVPPQPTLALPAPEPIPVGGASVPKAGGMPTPTASPSLAGKGMNMVKGFASPANVALMGAGLMSERVPDDVRADPEFSLFPTPMQQMGAVAQLGQDYGEKLRSEIGSEGTSQAGDLLRGITASITQFPAQVGYGIKHKAEGAAEAVGDFFTPRGELEKKAAREAEIEAANRVFEQMNDPNYMRTLQEQAILESQYDRMLGEQQHPADDVFEMGRVQLPRGLGTMPLPPKGADYTQLYDLMQRTLPNPPAPHETESNRGIMILAGLASGFLGSGDRPLGERLLAAGLGGLNAQASLDEKKRQAEQEFKSQMDDYWLRMAGVKKSEIEGDAEYRQRVWRNQMDQLRANASAANARLSAMQSKLVNTKDGLFIQEMVDNGDGTATRRLRRYDATGQSAQLGYLIKDLTRVFGDKDQAESVAMNLAHSRDPNRSMGLYSLAKAKSEGRTEALIKTIDQATDGEFTKALGETGLTFNTLPGGSEKTKNEMIDAERDALIIDMISRSDAIRAAVAPMLGLDTHVRLLESGRDPFKIQLRN